jgi:hypothetical protein
MKITSLGKEMNVTVACETMSNDRVQVHTYTLARSSKEHNKHNHCMLPIWPLAYQAWLGFYKTS